MYSSLNEMLASANRDEFRRQASRHGNARRSRQSRPRSARRASPGRLIGFGLVARRGEIRTATAA